MRHDWLRNWVNFKFRIVEDLFQSRFPDLIQWTVRFYFGRLFFSDEKLLADRGAAMYRGQTQLASMTLQLFAFMGGIIRMSAEPWATLSGKIARIAELDEVMEQLEMQQQASAGGGAAGATAGAAAVLHGGTVVHSNEEAVIELKEADIVTPAGVAMVSALSLRVTPQTPLMVTGASASGKSSLVRTLAGLWPLQAGELTRPAANNAHPKGQLGLQLKSVFVVPQKLHMCPGSLADQLTYPLKILASERTADQERELRNLLDLVGVGYLVERWTKEVKESLTKEDKENMKEEKKKGKSDSGNESTQAPPEEPATSAPAPAPAAPSSPSSSGWDHETAWQDVLSLGEQQRIGMCRLFYHRPQFAILDECTSAVSIEVEEKLYRAAAARGIACITLSQRLALEEFHTQELRLGEDTATGWTLHDLRTSATTVVLD